MCGAAQSGNVLATATASSRVSYGPRVSMMHLRPGYSSQSESMYVTTT